MSRIHWRWQERDFGFRFRRGKGRRAAEYYQARYVGEFYLVPASQRKLSKTQINQLAAQIVEPISPRVVANPWRNYDWDWDWIVTEDEICFNWAGCLDMAEIHRREDEGVQRARELVTRLALRAEPVPLTIKLVRDVHVALMGDIYPFASNWRTVFLHKGEGPTKWPLPPGGIQPLMDALEGDVLSRSPVISGEDDEVFLYASEVMNEILAIHPFREGNGRAVFAIGDLILMQNSMLPLDSYERRDDETRYFAACEEGRIRRNYEPLAQVIAEWEDRALRRWEESRG